MTVDNFGLQDFLQQPDIPFKKDKRNLFAMTEESIKNNSVEQIRRVFGDNL